MGDDSLGGIASKTAFGDTIYVVDSLVLCREKLRREDILV